jgi:benzoyl-CoA reductase subunit D
MTTHARGGIFLNPEARAVVDIGALNGRAIYIDERGKVLSYKMTSQCASGSGQFLENIARYLGVAVEEIGRCRAARRTPRRSARSAPCSPRPTSSTWCRAASPRPTS